MKPETHQTPETAHSPTPWKLQTHPIKEPQYGNGVVFSQGGAHRFVRIENVGSLETVDMDISKLEANGRLIIEAVNSHERLKAEVRVLKDTLQWAGRELVRLEADANAKTLGPNKCLVAIRKALAQTEGGAK